MGRRGRNAAAAAGLAATVILAAGFLVVALSRTSPTEPGSAQTYSQIQWHATKVPAESTLSPFVAVSNGRLYMVDDVRGAGPQTVQVWSSADAVRWEQAANPGMEPDFVARAAIADGSGGLIVVGEATPAEAVVVPQIWRSTDGKTFAKAQVQLPSADSAPGTSSGEIVATAAAAGQMVAFGDHDIVDMTKGAPEVRGLDAWHSTDGSTWTHSDMTGSDGYQAISLTAWSGGFAALADQPGLDTGYGVWLSADGVAWRKTGSVATIVAISIMALPDALVVVGAKQDATRGMVPASWSSADGATWTEAIASTTSMGVAFDGAIVVGHSVVAIAVSHAGTGTGTGGGSSQSPGPPAWVPPSTWISNDGSPWQLLGPAPAFTPYMASMTVFDGHLVVASTTGIAEVTVSVGDLT